MLDYSIHLTTKMTPFELQFGRKPNMPIDLFIPNVELHHREAIVREIIKNDEDLGEVL